MSTGDHGLRTRDGESIRKGRVSPALRTAITLIVLEGLTIPDAAKRTGYKTQSLEKALLKPHVKAFKSSVIHAWRQSKTERAWLTVADLAESACSEDTRLKAAKVFIDADEAARAAMPEQARQLVQIFAPGANFTAQLPHGQMSGVIEADAFQLPAPIPSNSQSVGRVENDDDDDA